MSKAGGQHDGAETVTGSESESRLQDLVHFVLETIDQLITLLKAEAESLHRLEPEALRTNQIRKMSLIGRYEDALSDLRNNQMPALSEGQSIRLREAMEDLRQTVDVHDRALRAVSRANQALMEQITEVVTRTTPGAPIYNRSGRRNDETNPTAVAVRLNDIF